MTVAVFRAQYDALGSAAVAARQRLIADWLERLE